LPCPYAERRGALVYCRARGGPVNPLAFPCLTERYQNCRFYREAEARKKAEKEAPPTEAAPREAPAAPAAPKAREEAGGAQPKPAPAPATRGLTADGRPARSCRECIFYSESLSRCLLLGVKVDDPDRPPCATKAL